MQLYDESGKVWRLGDPIASGGEGAVHRVGEDTSLCAKIYHRPIAPHKAAKLAALKSLPEAVRRCAALPLELVHGARGSREAIGVLLPHVEGHDIFELYHPQGRRARFHGVDFEFLLVAACNLARAFGVLHGHGIVVGDVNERNIKVRTDATLAFIDCDSFQFSDGTHQFTSDVGTLLWTPPELQGVALRGVVRSPNHDAFGLAQLIFLLLFGGRYPFAGRPLGNEAPSPEEAVARYLFAFDPEPERAVLEPPPGAPSFLSLPPDIRALFLRAFRKGSEQQGARPTPGEWLEALQALRGELTRCAQSRAHVHWRGAAHCPWCEVLESTGYDLFPSASGAPVQADAPVDYGELAGRLLALEFEPIHLVGPVHSSAGAVGAPRQGETESGVWWGAIARGLGPVGGFLLDARARLLRQRVEAAHLAVNAFHPRAAELFMRRAGEARPYLLAAREAGERLRDATVLEQGRLREWRESLRGSALRRYLEGFLLQRYELQGVGPGRLATLLSNNIVTAADIDAAALGALPGFNAQLVERLVRWRRDCERGFRFEAVSVLTDAMRARLKAEVREELDTVAKRGAALLKRVERVRLLYAKEVQALQSAYQEACARRAEAEADLRAWR